MFRKDNFAGTFSENFCLIKQLIGSKIIMKNKMIKVLVLLVTFLFGVFAFAFFYFQKPLPKVSKPDNLPDRRSI